MIDVFDYGNVKFRVIFTAECDDNSIIVFDLGFGQEMSEFADIDFSAISTFSRV